MKIGSINIGSKDKRNFFDLTHDNSTTCDFGFCQPTLVHAVMPNSSIRLKTHSFVRLAPMPCPTFGRIKVKQDNIYVPMKDVFLAFNEFISGNAVNNPNAGMYQPETVDYFESSQLFDLLLACSAHRSQDLTINDYFGINNSNIFRMFFTMSFSTNQDLTQGTPTEWHDLTDIVDSAGLSNTKRVNYVRFLSEILNDEDFMRFNVDGDANTYGLIDSLGLNSFNHCYGLNYLSQDGNAHNYYLPSFFRPNDVLAFADRPDDSGLHFDPAIWSLIKAFGSMPEQFRHFFNHGRSSENADFSYQFTPNHFPVISDWESENPQFDWNSQLVGGHEDTKIRWRINFHLTPFGKRIMKIFTANRWNFGINDFCCDLPKLFAYYKAWFDLYNVGRETQWTETTCYNLIHSFYDDPRTLSQKLYVDGRSNLKYNEYQNVIEFFTQLSMCCYNLDADPITVTTPEPLLTKGVSTFPFAGVTYPLSRLNTDNNSIEGGNNGPFGISNVYPTKDLENSFSLDSLSVQFLSRLYEYVNKESAIASQIEKYMQIKYGVDIRSTRRLRVSDFDVQISDIMGTVNNEQTELGEYAGKGIGAGDSGEIKFDVPEQGFIIQLTTIVPLGGYVQANEQPQLNRYDFYTPEYDSLGMEVVKQSDVFARDGIINGFMHDKTFGFRPRYFGLKYKNNLNNGDFAFRSSRSNMLPYCLDRLFTESTYNNFSTSRSSSQYGTVTYGNYHVVPRISLYPDERLRSLGLVEAFGNYDRIFYDTTGNTDNFILHQVHEFALYAPMKPIRDSFDTFDDEIDDSSKNVEHA